LRRLHKSTKSFSTKGFILIAVMLALLVVGAIAYLLNREGAMNVDMAVGESQAIRARYVAEAGLAFAEAKLNAAGSCASPPAAITGSVETGTPGVVDMFSVTATPASTAPLKINLTAVATLAGTNTGGTTLSKKVTLYTNIQKTINVSRVGAPSTNAGPISDTFLANQFPTSSVPTGSSLAANFGADPELIVDNGPKAGPILVKFNQLNPSPLPPDAKLISAYLGMAFNSAANFTLSGKPKQLSDITAHRITTEWLEGLGKMASNPMITTDASYNNAKTGSPWDAYSDSAKFIPYNAAGTNTNQIPPISSNGGGDYDPAYVARMEKKTTNPTSPPVSIDVYAPAQIDTFGFGNSQYVRWNITPLIAEWLSGADNYGAKSGVLLKAEQALGRASFYSSEAVNENQRPTLTLTYQVPCGTKVMPAIADTYLNSSTLLNYGTTSTLNIAKNAASEENALIQFANFGIPTTSTVMSAKLRLYVSNIIGRTINTDIPVLINPLTSASVWHEAETEWKRRVTVPGNINWVTLGALSSGFDFSTTGATSFTLSKTFVPGNWLEIPIPITAVQPWVTTPSSNNGFLLRLNPPFTTNLDEVLIASRESGANAPQLIITYQ
jgi:Tfp pilus assembly protein PilX